MKITIINGQNHKGSTYQIGMQLAKRLGKAEQINEIFLPRDMPKFCCGCTNCFIEKEEKCPHYNILSPLTEKLDAADVLIFTTPVYVYHTTGSMKAFLDHYGYRWMVHRPEEKMFKKQAVVIATAAGAGMKSACKDIRDSCFFWGIPKIYTYGIAVHAINWKKISRKKRLQINNKIEKLAHHVRKHHGKVKPGIKTKSFFYVMKLLQKIGWNEADVKYWAEKGWNKKKRPW